MERNQLKQINEQTDLLTKYEVEEGFTEIQKAKNSIREEIDMIKSETDSKEITGILEEMKIALAESQTPDQFSATALELVDSLEGIHFMTALKLRMLANGGGDIREWDNAYAEEIKSKTLELAKTPEKLELIKNIKERIRDDIIKGRYKEASEAYENLPSKIKAGGWRERANRGLKEIYSKLVYYLEEDECLLPEDFKIKAKQLQDKLPSLALKRFFAIGDVLRDSKTLFKEWEQLIEKQEADVVKKREGIVMPEKKKEQL